jgi:hypothetical protein
MPNGNLATLSLDALAERLAPRIAPQISVAAGISGALAERSDTLSATGNEPLQPTFVVLDSPLMSALRGRKAEPGFTIAILLCLLSLGIVAITTVAAFFGAAFLLLAHPAPEMIAGADAHDRGAEVKAMGSSALAFPTGDPPPVTAQTELSLSAGPIHPLVAAFAEYLATQHPVWRLNAVPRQSVARSPNIDLTPPSQTASAPEPILTYSAAPAAAALPARPRSFVAKNAKGRATPHPPAAADEGITFEQYRDARVQDLRQRQARLEQQLTEPALSTTETRRLKRQKAYHDRLAAMPVEERDRRLRQRFDEIDTNHDGKLDEEEVASHVNHLHSN